MRRLGPQRLDFRQGASLVSAASLVIGFVVPIGLLMCVGSFFGPDWFEYMIFGARGCSSH